MLDKMSFLQDLKSEGLLDDGQYNQAVMRLKTSKDRDDKISNMKQNITILKKLKEDGVLSEEEFRAKSEKILSDLETI